MRSRWQRLGAILVFWIVAAALTGLLHGLEILVERHVFDRLAWFSREFAWMSPIAYGIVMGPGALLLAALVLVTSRTWALSFAAGAFGTVAVFGLLLPYPQVSRTASLILAMGLGVVIARAVHARPSVWIDRARVTAIVCVAAIAIFAPAQRAIFSFRESRAIANLPEAPASSPNVLVIILDTMRAASMSLYGATQPTTPHLQEWSTSATVFDWAFSPAPWTLPSHSSMFTGVWAGRQSGDWERALDGAHPTLAERFRDRGYLTGGFVANMHYTAWDSGLQRGFARYEDYLVNWRQMLLSSSYTQTELFEELTAGNLTLTEKLGRLAHPNLSISPKHRFVEKRGGAVTDAFLAWQASSGHRPFFAFLNYFDAHAPYYAPAEFRKFSGGREPASYLAATAFLDSEIDRVLRTLQERGALDQTLVIVTSDHGELFRFKGLSGHAHNLYLNTLHVPLMLRLPGRVPAGTRIAQSVTLRDLAATILDLVAPDAPGLPGTSLATTWTQTGAPSPVLAEVSKARNVDTRYPTSRGDLQTLLDERWQLIRNGDDRVELYDYRADSLPDLDLAGNDSSAALVAALRQRLLDLLRERR